MENKANSAKELRDLNWELDQNVKEANSKEGEDCHLSPPPFLSEKQPRKADKEIARKMDSWVVVGMCRTNFDSLDLETEDWGKVLLRLYTDDKEYAYQRIDEINNAKVWKKWSNEKANQEISQALEIEQYFPISKNLVTVVRFEESHLKQALIALSYLRFNQQTVERKKMHLFLTSKLKRIMHEVYNSVTEACRWQYFTLYLACLSPDLYHHALWGLEMPNICDPKLISNDCKILSIRSTQYFHHLCLGNESVISSSKPMTGIQSYADLYAFDVERGPHQRYIFVGKDTYQKMKLKINGVVPAADRIDIVAPRKPWPEKFKFEVYDGKEKNTFDKKHVEWNYKKIYV